MSRRADNRAGGRPAAEWMRRAVALARDTHPHPNPRVGAVVVAAGGRFLAEAAHPGPGQAHAEAAALAAAGDEAAGATLFVTLEPCDHHGATGPCTEAILASGVTHVVYGARDPDRRVSGAGARRLREAGIDVVGGVLAEEVRAVDAGYFHHRTTGRPLVTLKMAATLDGQAAAADGSSQWITSTEAREHAHRLRARSDAVMIGAGTLLADDPRLDVRLADFDGAQPRPVVVAGSRPLPDDARLYARQPLIYSATERADVPTGASVAVVGDPFEVDLAAMMKDLGARGFVDVLVEGGPTLAGALLDDDLVDRLVLHLGGRLAGGVGLPMFRRSFATLADARSLSIDSVDVVGPDLVVVAGLEGSQG
ncbi:MAG: bifunctional diaminohydroxyphosphoribosylaminopyrimidine deaminase/5-amino-6-(5-phosphoribosylamino)uracil reductase RibD [Acidimicrobiia bacterium]